MIKNIERKYYLDYIRIVSMMIVLLFHFGGFFSVYPSTSFFSAFANGKNGSIGVFLFFMISGCALFNKYDGTYSIIDFYKKRLLKLLIPFWTFYVFFFVWNFCEYKVFPEIPLINAVFTVFGMDGYFTYRIQTFYLIGEWFLGAIIILYLLFPLLNYLIKKNIHIIFSIISFFFFLHSAGLFKNIFVISDERNIITGLFFFVYGYWIDFMLNNYGRIIIIKLISCIVVVIGSVSLFIVLPITKLFAGFLVVSALFILFFYMDTFFAKIKYGWGFKWLVDNSYFVFLVHHFLLAKISVLFAGYYFSLKGFFVVLFVWFMSIIIVVELYHSVCNRIKIYKQTN